MKGVEGEGGKGRMEGWGVWRGGREGQHGGVRVWREGRMEEVGSVAGREGQNGGEGGAEWMGGECVEEQGGGNRTSYVVIKSCKCISATLPPN